MFTVSAVIFVHLRPGISIYQQDYQHSTGSKQPHIIFILADDMGFHDVGYHGSNISTPNLDELAMSGVRLENYYVQAICSPTRAALLTGRYSIHTGVQRVYYPGQPLGLSLEEVTLAEKLKETGYSTHIVGKWHLGFYKRSYLPTNRGFDSFFGFYNGFTDYFTHISRHYRGIQGYDLMENETPANWSMYDGIYSSDLYAERTIDIIRKHDSQKPLFVYLALQSVHSPVQAPEKCLKPKNSTDRTMRDLYEGMIVCMDDAVGKVVRALKEKGIWGNTILVFSSDNGGPSVTGASNFPLRGFKATGWEGGVRGVGFINSPLLSKKVARTVSKELMHVTDWFPTLLNVAGGSLNGTKPLDGFDQWDCLKYGSPSKRKEILHDILPSSPPTQPFPKDTLDSTTSLRRASIRIGKWKLLKEFRAAVPALEQFDEAKRVYLSDIEKDPTEDENLADQFQDVVTSMLHRIKYYLNGTVPIPNPIEDQRADPRFRRGFWEPWMD